MIDDAHSVPGQLLTSLCLLLHMGLHQPPMPGQPRAAVRILTPMLCRVACPQFLAKQRELEALQRAQQPQQPDGAVAAVAGAPLATAAASFSSSAGGGGAPAQACTRCEHLSSQLKGREVQASDARAELATSQLQLASAEMQLGELREEVQALRAQAGKCVKCGVLEADAAEARARAQEMSLRLEEAGQKLRQSQQENAKLLKQLEFSQSEVERQVRVEQSC